MLATKLEAGATFETIDKDVTAYYPPAAYFYAPLEAGQQNFRLLSNAPALTDSRAFKGVRVPLTGEPAPFDGTAGTEGDVIVPEPVQGAGLIGLYALARHESRTYLAADVIEVARWLVQKYIDKMPDGDDKIAGLVAGFLAGLGELAAAAHQARSGRGPEEAATACACSPSLASPTR